MSGLQQVCRQAQSIGKTIEQRVRRCIKGKRKPPPPLQIQTLSDYKQAWSAHGKVLVSVFLASQSKLVLPRTQSPQVSIILVLRNCCELTYLCLCSILANCSGTPYEVILVDNASTDETPRLLDAIEPAKIVRNSENVGFLHAVNQAVQRAEGEIILLLNNDTQLVGDGISEGVKELERHPDVGAVGGRLILPDGRLQEAGSIVWSDGITSGFGRGEDPFAEPFHRPREADYCSGAFLMLRRADFLNLNGFDDLYAPAYYEETDLCVRLRQNGKRVVYLPTINVLHYEFGSSHQGYATELCERNRLRFQQKHREWLQHQPPASQRAA